MQRHEHLRVGLRYVRARRVRRSGCGLNPKTIAIEFAKILDATNAREMFKRGLPKVKKTVEEPMKQAA